MAKIRNFAKNYQALIYPHTFEHKTGFDQVRTMLKKYCLSQAAVVMVDQMQFLSDAVIIGRLLGETDEMRRLLDSNNGFPSQDYFDLVPALKQIKVEGTYLDTETLINLQLSLITITRIVELISKLDIESYPHLTAINPSQLPPQEIIHQINRLLDEKGDIRDNASERLLKLRKEIHSRTSSIDRKINQVFALAKRNHLVNDDAELTIRNGRLVIPIPAGNKRKLNGYVHDTSATGQTVFIEPAEVFEINNEIQNLSIEERQEIIRILQDFASSIRPQLPELEAFYIFLGVIDFIRAKARLAAEMEAVKPLLSSGPTLNWQHAVHPLLKRSLQQQGRKIVDQNIALSPQERIMIISGPNAGGKSVTLKTTALLQYMLQCGLLIPVKEISEAGIFKQIFLEIGDEQSLENDLSTYSSHLIHIKHFLEKSNEQTLILIDEFGAGTEPQLGGAMAEASLAKLNALGCYGIITTHYTNLKLMPAEHPGIFNAAMLYDTREMRPLFKLSPGKPGSSFAFEIARKIGFPDQVLDAAKSKVGSSQLNFEQQLNQLEVDQKAVQQTRIQLQVADETLASLVQRYEKLLKELETTRQAQIKDAKAKARQLLDNANRLIENTIRDIKENQAEKEITRQLRDELQQKKEALLSGPHENEITTSQIFLQKSDKTKQMNDRPRGPIKAGHFVKMEGQESIGKVMDIKGKQATVIFGNITIRTKTERLIPATPQEVRMWEANQHFGKTHSGVIHQLNDKMAGFKMSIDIRGKKAEEASTFIARYIDQAILLNVKEVRILHGKGDGVLRNLLHEHLRDTREVVSFEDESLERGGHGVTIVRFS